MRRYRPLPALPDIPHFHKSFSTMQIRTFFEYLPKRFKARSEQDEKVRNFIYDFKLGRDRATRFAAVGVANFLFRSFGSQCDNYTLVCVPARNKTTYRKRFGYFAKEVEELCGIKNAMDHVIIVGEREALHNTTNHCVCESAYDVILDFEWFKGRKVIIFDDIYTSGETANRFAEELRQSGATIIGGMFLAKTIWKGGRYESK